MKVTVNGEIKEVDLGVSLADYLRQLTINLETVVVESDGGILQRDEYETHILKEGMELELIRFIGGG
jgi:sulfur carrier protein